MKRGTTIEGMDAMADAAEELRSVVIAEIKAHPYWTALWIISYIPIRLAVEAWRPGQ